MLEQSPNLTFGFELMLDFCELSAKILCVLLRFVQGFAFYQQFKGGVCCYLFVGVGSLEDHGLHEQVDRGFSLFEKGFQILLLNTTGLLNLFLEQLSSILTFCLGEDWQILRIKLVRCFCRGLHTILVLLILQVSNPFFRNLLEKGTQCPIFILRLLRDRHVYHGHWFRRSLLGQLVFWSLYNRQSKWMRLIGALSLLDRRFCLDHAG